MQTLIDKLFGRNKNENDNEDLEIIELLYDDDDDDEPDVLEILRDILRDEGIRSGAAFIVNEDNLIIGYQLVFGTDVDYFMSDPVMLDWPMQPMPVPEAMIEQNGELN